MKRALFATLAALTLAACDKNAQEASQPASAPAQTAPVAAANPALLSPEKATEKAPDSFKVRFETTKGPFVVEARRAWAPNGADRFYNLVKLGYYDDVAFFRVLSGFMAQTGIHGDPAVAAKWRDARIPDDPAAGKSNKRGMVSFATAGPHTRTTQIFFNFVDNSMLDDMGFTPFAQVVEGLETLDQLYSRYGEGAPQGGGPEQMRIQTQGNQYLRAQFPNLDYIKTARLVP